MTDSVVDGAFAHLGRLSDEVGVFEHAEYATARREHGYCVDDMARVLLVTVRTGAQQSTVVRRLEHLAFEFVLEAQLADGTMRNRRSVDGKWSATATTDDCWGRAYWGLGETFARSADATRRKVALERFEQGASMRSPWRRSMAFGALGAAAVLEVEFDNRPARELLIDATKAMRIRHEGAKWRWPERRLSYANAVIPNAMLAAGAGLLDDALLMEGLELLAWLVGHELRNGAFSVTPAPLAGQRRDHARFDQQPIELEALSGACSRAHRITGDAVWAERALLAREWFLGRNDLGVSMVDADSGGCYDGLCANGPNLNQGAESTLSLISTFQSAEAIMVASP